MFGRGSDKGERRTHRVGGRTASSPRTGPFCPGQERCCWQTSPGWGVDGWAGVLSPAGGSSLSPHPGAGLRGTRISSSSQKGERECLSQKASRGGGKATVRSAHPALSADLTDMQLRARVLEWGSHCAGTRSQVARWCWSEQERRPTHQEPTHCFSFWLPLVNPPFTGSRTTGSRRGRPLGGSAGPAWPFRSLPSAEGLRPLGQEPSLSRPRASSCPVCELGRQPPRERAEPKTAWLSPSSPCTAAP